MMKKFLSILAGAALLASCSGNKYSVTATMPDSATDGDTIVMTDYFGDDTLATAVIKNKCFHIEGDIKKPVMANIAMGDMNVFFVLEPGDLVIDSKTGDVTGSSLNEKMTAELKDLQAVGEDEDALLALIEKKYEENKENPIGKMMFFMGIQYNDYDYAELEKLIKEAPADYAEMRQVKKSLEAAKLSDATREGTKFVDFSAVQEDGNEMKLSDFVGKDYLVVDFWASWCGPCRRAIKGELMDIYNKYNGKGLRILGVAVRDEIADTKKAVEMLQIPWDIMYNTGRVPYEIYGFTGIPHIMIIAPDGTILSRGEYGDDLKKKVDEIMSEKK